MVEIAPADAVNEFAIQRSVIKRLWLFGDDIQVKSRQPRCEGEGIAMVSARWEVDREDFLELEAYQCDSVKATSTYSPQVCC